MQRYPFAYSTEQEAALGLLGESCGILDSCGVEYVVVGGWRPFLFCGAPIPHPGTFDVDVLLRETTSRAAFDAAAQQLLAAGYLRAPKNQFQAHRVLTVGDEPLLFHVDFLHRRYAPDVNDNLIEWGKFQSIAGPGTDIIFELSEYSQESIDVVLPSGNAQTVNIRFASEVGILATKGRSAGTAKRTRDAFDIYLILKQSRDYSYLVSRCAEICYSALFRLSLDAIREGFSNGTWSKNAAAYLAKASPSMPDPEAEVRAAVSSFFTALEDRRAPA
jgi:hypothetical protein